MHLALHSVNLLFKKAIFNEKKQGKARGMPNYSRT